MEITGGYQALIKPATSLGLTTLAEVPALTVLATLGPTVLATRFARDAAKSA